MRIVIVWWKITSNYIFGIWTRLLPGSADAWTSVLFIIMVRVTISTLVSTSNVLIILDQRTLGYVVIIIEALSNILNLSRLKRATLILLVCLWTWLLLWCSIEVARCHSKLFHINLWILFIIIKHLMILTLSQLVLTLESHSWLLHMKFVIIPSGHLLIAIISINLFLPWWALTVEWVYLWWLYDSLVFRVDVCQLWLHVLLVAPVAIVAIRVLQGSLLTLYQHLLVILILVEVLLVIEVVASEELIRDISVVLDSWLFLVCISIVIIKSTSCCSSCVSHYCLQIHFDSAVFLIILSLNLLGGQLLGMGFIIW